MRIEVSAPSNIALIKYMGKSLASGNLPTNASMSYTLEHLRSHVVLEPAQHDEWKPLKGYLPISLGETGRTKFLNHFARLKSAWEIPGCYSIASANDFPSDCGLASSASSFAALSLGAYELARSIRPEFELSRAEISRWSRLGSGSSCRSLFSPWAQWRGEGAEPMELDLRLEHAVVIVEGSAKTVSSSQAHSRVPSSLLFEGREVRAEARMLRLCSALKESRWYEAFEICWAEFWDMHSLFETSEPSFGYMHPESLSVLHKLRQVWKELGDGPLVTMDAGANIHLLLRPEQMAAADSWLTGLRVLKSWKS